MTRFRLGTRGSPLALAQAAMVQRALAEAHRWPLDAIEIVVIKTTGDAVQDRALAEIGGKALWTKELDHALIAGEIDAAVHSMKDVETVRPGEIIIAAMLPRADVRDRLVGAPSIAALSKGAVIGTSSPRRAAQLRHLRPDLRIATLRGNVDTRLAKVEAGVVDATLLAAAGLDRLGRGEVGAAIAVDVMLPAPGQGAVGIEACTDSAEAALVAAIADAPTMACVGAERALLAAIGADCHSPMAALAVVEGDRLWLRAELLSADGTARIQGEARGAIGDTGFAAVLGADLLARAPDAVRAQFGS